MWRAVKRATEEGGVEKKRPFEREKWWRKKRAADASAGLESAAAGVVQVERSCTQAERRRCLDLGAERQFDPARLTRVELKGKVIQNRPFP